MQIDISNYNLQPCLQSNEIKKIFWELFKNIPNIYNLQYTQAADVDTEKFSQEILLKYSEEDQIHEVFSRNYKDKLTQYVFTVKPKEGSPSIAVVDSDSVAVYTTGKTIDQRIKEVFDDCMIPEKPSGTLSLVTYCDGEYNLIDSDIKKTDIDVSLLYNDDFPPEYARAVDFLNSNDSGLIIWYGTKGSGKTSMIRHLINNTNKHYILINNSLIESLSDPTFMDFLLDWKESVLILEDCEQAIADRTVNSFGNSVSNLLNMSDGLMSDILKLKFICTFNTKIENIDEALLRKGRCRAKYEFKELSADKVAIVNKERDLKIPEDKIKKMTLADMFNFHDESYEQKQTRIGFGS